MIFNNKQQNIIVFITVLLLIPFVLTGQSNSGATYIKTVVIDAGHGGRDPGALSKNNKVKEKDITLAVALKLGNLIKQEFPKIKVVYTRKTDVYVNLSERANIANRNKADLFISIHVNANKSTQPRGTETFVMGASKNDENFEVCKAENSVIIIEDDYQRRYEGFNPNSPESYIIFSLLQNTHKEQSLQFADYVQQAFEKGPIKYNRGVKQGGLLVLWKTTMPAVLTEIGFISNTKDCAILTTKDGQNKVAKGLFDAFVDYKTNFEYFPTLAKEDSKKEEKTHVENKNTNKSPDKILIDSTEKVKIDEKSFYREEKIEDLIEDDFYAIQILSVNKILKNNSADLKGRRDCKYVKEGKLYKYFLGNYDTKENALKELSNVRKIFKGAFVIHIRDNKIIRE